MLSSSQIQRFRSDLLQWFAAAQRDLPWRRTRDPYAIWISEVMLQQTRVAAAIPYYERFLERFPSIKSLAESVEQDLLSHWAGLGYYYRARNLQKAARLMRDAGGFPASYVEIRSLPGIGDYTAAAVASIAFNQPHAAVDGNVIRVVSRVFNDPANSASAKGRKQLTALAGKLLDPQQPGAFNQAMMELGATICLPRNPQCLLCPVAGLCEARKKGTQSALPLKVMKTKSVDEERVVFWIEQDAKLLVWQRPATSRLMPGFWELPEAAHLESSPAGRKLGSFHHGITFHNYRFDVVAAAAPANLGLCQWMPLSQLPSVPASTILKKALRLVEKLAKSSKGVDRMWTKQLGILAIFCFSSFAGQTPQADTLKQRPLPPPGTYQVDAGTHILLNMINSVSTKQAVAGDRIYLETSFPVLAANRILIPQGSWVTGTITEVKRPGRVKGRGELQVRFDSLTLPNGVSRSFRSDLGALDARNDETLQREDSKIKGPGDKKGDTDTVIRSTAEGAAIGTGVGAAAGHIGGGSLIGLAAGGAGGLIGVLATRGPDATLSRGSTVEMILDRPLTFNSADLDLSNAPPHAALVEGAPPATKQTPGWRPF